MSAKPNAIVAQSGGPTAVINSSACGVIQQAVKSDRIGCVIGATNGILGVLKEDLFDLSAEKPETIEALKQTPAAAIGSCRYKLKSIEHSKADFERILDVFRAHNIRYFFYAGGNDSMDTADKVNKLAADSGYELTCMGIPKTVDNDLAFTDHCPGYPSVAKYVATCAAEAGRDTEALYTTDTCTILEVMGRNAGWIAAATGLAHRTAVVVAAGAGNAHAHLDVGALALAHRQVALTHHHAVHHATAATHGSGHHLAHVLQGGGGHFVLAKAGHLHAALALFHLHRAAGNHAHLHAAGGHAGHRAAAHRRTHRAARAQDAPPRC